MLAVIFVVGCAALALSYWFYGGKLEKWLDVNNENPTPAHSMNDGVDYVAAETPVLFGHHYSSIAGAGPIVGPIVAGLLFGWLPALLWILVGSIFIGGVHDYTSLIASIRNRGRSIGEMCRLYLSPLTYRIFLLFVWFTLVYVLIVFLDLTASTFQPVTGGAPLKPNSVATASVFYIVMALVFGLAVYKFKVRFGVATMIFVPLVFAGLLVGELAPLTASKNVWLMVLLVYCFVASIAPVWVLLQPRDFLSSFLLYACLFAGGIGLLLFGLTGKAQITYPAFQGWVSERGEFLFPVLFITVACGAVSGFHSIVASGTTSKQLKSEKSARPVAYGSMLVEGVLALIALGTVMIAAKGTPSTTNPVVFFSKGIGNFAAMLGIPAETGAKFGVLAVSTFLLTTLDTGTRLTRFVVEEFFSLSGRRWRYLSTAAALALPAVIVFLKIPDPAGAGFLPAWRAIWPAFGTTNQLLAALALLVVFVWITATRVERKAFVVLPMLFMLTTAGTSLVMLIKKYLLDNLTGADGQVVVGNACVGSLCAVLLVLAVIVVVDTVQFTLKQTSGEANPAFAE